MSSKPGGSVRRPARTLCGMARVLTPQAEDFPRWYQDVLAKAELAENGPVRGTMVIRPYGYAHLGADAGRDGRPDQGGRRARTPTSRCSSRSRYLRREAEHVEGFSPELAVVTHRRRQGAGGADRRPADLARRSSASSWPSGCRRYRDLPLLLNQWANVVRWELRPRLLPAHHRVPLAGGPHRARDRAGRPRLRAHGSCTTSYEDFMVDVLAHAGRGRAARPRGSGSPARPTR